MAADWFARVLGGISLLISGLALWLNWQKNERDLASTRPQVGHVSERTGPRQWKIRVTVMNPRQVPIAWRLVRVLGPEGALISARDPAERPYIRSHEYADHSFVEGYPLMIPPGASETWDGYVFIDDRYGAAEDAVPIVEPVIDGFESRPSRLRRIAKWIWPRPTRI